MGSSAFHEFNNDSGFRIQAGDDLCLGGCLWFANKIIPQEEIERQLAAIKRYKLVGIEMSKTDSRFSIAYSIEAKWDTLAEVTDRLTKTEGFDSYTIE